MCSTCRMARTVALLQRPACPAVTHGRRPAIGQSCAAEFGTSGADCESPFPMRTSKIFRLVLIKPSHYDNDGYVIRWWRGGLPSNSLACLYGIALDCRERRVLGADFDIDIEAIDETNWKVRIEDLTRSIKAADAGMVMLVGVQSNQFPRSLDLARQFRRRGIQVAVGGFHVSGTLSMLPERDPGVREMMDLGVSVFA